MELLNKRETFAIDDDRRIDATVANDTLNDPDHELVTVRFLSPRWCKIMEKTSKALGNGGFFHTRNCL